MAQAHYLVDKDGNKFYPYAHADAAYDRNGVTVGKRLDDLEAGASGGTITGVSVNGTSIATSGVANITSMPASILDGAIKNGVTATTQTQGDNSTKVATTAYVDKAVADLPEPMIFKGSLGTGGTITTLPTPSVSNEGFTYKVITDGTYASQSAKIGDTFISTGSKWELIPSGDEPSGTVTSVGVSVPTGLSVSNTPVTSSGTIAISMASGYSIPTTTKQTSWDNKYSKPTDGIPATDMTTGVQNILTAVDALKNATITYNSSTQTMSFS